MHQLLNSLINLLKWPVAIFSVLLFIPVSQRLWNVLDYIYRHFDAYSLLFYGMLGYFILWHLWFKKSAMARWFGTLEHELTHVIFAILSLNRVTALNATSHSGGEMRYQGYGNWIISLAPYFVATLSLIILLVLSLAKTSHYPVLLFLMGFSIAYHLQSTWQETHLDQTDLQKSGWVFVCLFLPTANLLMILVILTALPNDALSTGRSLNYVWQDLQQYWFALKPLLGA